MNRHLSAPAVKRQPQEIADAFDACFIRRYPGAQLESVRASTAVLYAVLTGEARKNVGIAAGSAFEHVVSAPAVQAVIARAGGEQIIAAEAVHAILDAAAVEHVVGKSARDIETARKQLSEAQSGAVGEPETINAL